jgi:hypothetical protein
MNTDESRGRPGGDRLPSFGTEPDPFGTEPDRLKPNRYTVSKTSGEPIDPEAQYFVLRVDKDPHALLALSAYALSLESAGENLALAEDLYEWIARLRLGIPAVPRGIKRRLSV